MVVQRWYHLKNQTNSSVSNHSADHYINQWRSPRRNNQPELITLLYILYIRGISMNQPTKPFYLTIHVAFSQDDHVTLPWTSTTMITTGLATPGDRWLQRIVLLFVAFVAFKPTLLIEFASQKRTSVEATICTFRILVIFGYTSLPNPADKQTHSIDQYRGWMRRIVSSWPNHKTGTPFVGHAGQWFSQENRWWMVAQLYYQLSIST